MVKRQAALVLALVLLLVGGWWVSQPLAPSGEERVESEEAAETAPDPVVEAVREAGPATVKIETRREVVVDQFFFQTLEEQEGIGSGFVFRSDGYILTNSHVVADAAEIVVRMPDGRSYAGEVIGQDPMADLAVIKIEAEDLPMVTLADSNELQVGQRAIAIGNPLGQDHSVTTGIVSALERDLLLDPEAGLFLEGMIQTDAAINPGSSGGPLLDENGHVMGITTALLYPAQGMGFAIPSNAAARTAEQIIEHGRPIRLGIVGGTLTPTIAEAIVEQTDLELGAERGAIITQVLPDSPAEKAGLARYDVITAVGDQTIGGMRQLRELVLAADVGTTLDVHYYRKQEQRQVDVILE